MMPKGYKHSQETKEKIRKANLNREYKGGWQLSEETKKKISNYAKNNLPKYSFKKGYIPWNKGLKGVMPNGENHPSWIKDRTKLKKEENKAYDYAYQYWAKEVKNRDNWKCKINNKDCKGRLESHHILSWKDYPELRYNINNGITLCLAHHPRKRAEEKRLIPFFSELVSVSSELL
jgi:hypothetical protein